MITTHVLDTSLGRPAREIPIVLERLSGTDWVRISAGQTDSDGRLKTLTPAGPLTQGVWRLRFETKSYFEATGRVGFYPYVDVVFEIIDGTAHYHVPLLLNPWGYSTYRGS